jgi:ribosome-associated protein
MQAIYLAKRIARMAWAKKAEDIVIIDVRGLTEATDFFVICTGTVGMHVRAITDFVVDEARAIGERTFVTEKDSDEWMVADFVDVTFHCFQPQKRLHYNLERLWCDGPRLNVDDRTGKTGSLKDARADLVLRMEKAAQLAEEKAAAKAAAKEAKKAKEAGSKKISLKKASAGRKKV